MQRNILKYAIVLICAVAVTNLKAVTTYSTMTEATKAGATVGSDANGPVSPGSLPISSTSTTGEGVDFLGDPDVAEANVNGLGYTSVLADGAWADGSGDIFGLTATTTTLETVTNSSGGSLDYSYDFFIVGPTLSLFDYAGASAGQTGAPSASYRIDILLDGSSIFSSSAVLNGGSNSHTLVQSGTSLSPIFDASSSGSEITYNFDPFSVFNLDLGSFGDGSTFSLETVMTASVTSAGFELGGLASIGDPGTVTGGPFGISSVPTQGGGGPGPGTGVPDSGTTAILLGASLMGLAAIRRKLIK